MKPRILLLDDEESLIKWLSYALEQKGYQVFATTNARRALNKLKDTRFDCMISDIRMPGIDGYEFLRRVRALTPDTPVIFITAYGSMESAINALRDRASDYVLKPFSIEELLLRIRTCTSKPRVSAQHIIGESKQMKNIIKLVRKIATTDTTVLILGESGTGKELIAREIHSMSKRSHHKFVSISCAALPETLLESELFGYKKGAFTGATTDKDGLFTAAHRGTFFLDEIGDAPASIQMKLLRFLEEKQIVPLGGTQSIKVDVRLVAATNKDLMHEVKKGRFREDLYYRLNVIPVVLPPLRQRHDDIPTLAEYFLKSVCKKEGLGEKQFLKTTMERLTAYRWPGNIRELRHVVERAAVLSDAYYLKPEHLGLPAVKPGRLQDLERAEIERVLKECHGNITHAAQVLGMARATLYRKLRSNSKRKTKKQRKS